MIGIVWDKYAFAIVSPFTKDGDLVPPENYTKSEFFPAHMITGVPKWVHDELQRRQELYLHKNAIGYEI